MFKQKPKYEQFILGYIFTKFFEHFFPVSFTTIISIIIGAINVDLDFFKIARLAILILISFLLHIRYVLLPKNPLNLLLIVNF